MKRMILFLAVFLAFCSIGNPSLADDTEIFFGGGSMRPNVLIILDNSESMKHPVPYEPWPIAIYPISAGCNNLNCVPDGLYYQCCTQWRCETSGTNPPCEGEGCPQSLAPPMNQERKALAFLDKGWSDWNLISEAHAAPQCPKAGCVAAPTCEVGKTAKCRGYRYIPVDSDFSADQWRDDSEDGVHDAGLSYPLPVACGYIVYMGNRINYDNWSPKPLRIDEAKKALREVLTSTDSVNFGLMNFQYQRNYDPEIYPGALRRSDGGVLIVPCGQDGRNQILSKLSIPEPWNDPLYPRTATPLAETLTHAGMYFKGDFPDGLGRGGKFPSPIQANCQNNYVILITDGEPTCDSNQNILQIFLGTDKNTWDKPGTPADIEDNKNGKPLVTWDAAVDIDTNIRANKQRYLDDVAYVLYRTNLRPDLGGTTNLKTYTVGFTHRSTLLQNTALKGGGQYQIASNASQLASVLSRWFTSINDAAGTLAAVALPTAGMTSGNSIYVPWVEPQINKAFWSGDLIKYSLPFTTDSWGTEVWKANTSIKAQGTRTIYTLIRENQPLRDSVNRFEIGNTSLTAAKLGNPTSYTRDQVINFILGFDVLDENRDRRTDDKREFVLGDVLHSTPEVVSYASGEKVIFFGANDGMLHALDDRNGNELWAFIPPIFLEGLQDLLGRGEHPYYVDGTPKVVRLTDADGDLRIARPGESVVKRILIFGLRKGGNSYYALDVTNPGPPEFLWSIGPQGEYGELGQTWAEPVFGNVKRGNNTYAVAFIGGGYDSGNQKGRAVYAVNVLNGQRIWYVKNNGPTDAMKYSIPSRVVAVDVNGDGFIDRVYVGDMGGQLWGFGIYPADDRDNPTQDGKIDRFTARVLFQAPKQGEFFLKIFEYPDIAGAQDGYYLFFGTGDREDPKERVVVNRIYMVKDKNTPISRHGTLTEGDLADLTTRTATMDEIMYKYGWFIKLNQNPGEKVLATANVYRGTAYFTTFTPNPDLCTGGGDARAYAVGALNAAATSNLNKSNDTGGASGTGVVKDISDRSVKFGDSPGIPSAISMLFRGQEGGFGGTVSPFTNVGDKKRKIDDLELTGSLVPYSWRECEGNPCP